jgi:hypothetical protein
MTTSMSKQVVVTVSAACATTVAVVLGCLQSVVWHGRAAPLGPRAVTAWIEPALLNDAGASAALQPPAAYFAHGRLTLVVYLGLWIAAVASRKLLPRWAQRAAAAGGAVATAGDVLAYWLSAGSGPWLRLVGFWYLELPALAFVTVVLAIAGIAAVRNRRGGGVFVLAVPAAVAGIFVLEYMPHGILVGLGATIVVAGARGRGSHARASRPSVLGDPAHREQPNPERHV